MKNYPSIRFIYCLIGLGGVQNTENQYAYKLGKWFRYFSLLIALLLLAEWESQLKIPIASGNVLDWLLFDIVIWSFFVVQFFWMSKVVDNPRKYILQNWLLPCIIILGFPLFWEQSLFAEMIRSCRLLLVFLLIVPAFGLLVRFFVDGRLATSSFAAGIIVVFFGILVAGVDPAVSNAWDGIWWALATVSTVGYGDVVPTTFLGRALGAALVVLGLGIFVVLTANVLALLLREEAKKKPSKERVLAQILEEIQRLRGEQKHVLLLLKLYAEDAEDREDKKEKL